MDATQWIRSPRCERRAHRAWRSLSVRRLDLEGLGGFAAPVMGFDHYRMSGPTFAPHPHAGFSAVSYVFENSKGGLRNRDSLQHDLVIEPGAMVWTQAGSGVVHDEFPAQAGREVHGVQIFINLASRNKTLSPRMLPIAAADVPVVSDASEAQLAAAFERYRRGEMGRLAPLAHAHH